MTTQNESRKAMETLTGNPNLVGDSGINAPPKDPIELLRTWFDTAIRLNVCEPYGITLATVDVLGRPSTRVVLLKGFDERGFLFATIAAVATVPSNLVKLLFINFADWWSFKKCREMPRSLNLAKLFSILQQSGDS